MWEWWSSQPQQCLKFGTESLAWAENVRGWRGQRRRRCVTASLPNGTIIPSPMGPNISDFSGVADRIRTLTQSGSKTYRVAKAADTSFPRRVAILIPDTAVRATMLYFEQLPSSWRERNDLIRWRLGQEQLFPINGAKIVSQVFSDEEADESGIYTVLTVSIQESVLHQYESLCESVGLIPCDVGITSLRLLDLWRRVSKQSEWLRRNVLWVTVFDRALTIIVCQGKRPIFYRCKLLGESIADGLSNADMLNRVLEECAASLEASHQRHSSVTIDQAVICAEGEVSALREHFEDELHLTVEQLDWKSVEALGWVAKGTYSELTPLAALAGLP